MRISHDRKERYRVYRLFLESLSPEAAQIVYSNRGLAITSRAFSRKMAVVSIAKKYPVLARVLKEHLRPRLTYPSASSIVQCLTSQARKSVGLSSVFNSGILQSICARPQMLSRESIQNLFGATSLVCQLNGEDDCLTEFDDAEFV
jgi:hypothetical protein